MDDKRSPTNWGFFYLIETGAHGGKGSKAHEAAVGGDTIGDPFKDTAGLSLHVLIKLLATITRVLAPFFI